MGFSGNITTRSIVFRSSIVVSESWFSGCLEIIVNTYEGIDQLLILKYGLLCVIVFVINKLSFHIVILNALLSFRQRLI